MQKLVAELKTFIHQQPRLLIITGAGCSKASGIPTYRNADGDWQAATPIQHQAFTQRMSERRRYWLRSFFGWQVMSRAQPNSTHHAIAELETRGYCQHLVTQNVDGLHQQAGHTSMSELHGGIARVICLGCGEVSKRADMQARLQQAIPKALQAKVSKKHQLLADGDYSVDDDLDLNYAIPACLTCDGTLKPDVVFYGGSVAKPLVESIYQQLNQSDSILVVGSSLQVFSSYRFCRRAAELSKPICILNDGTTRADELASLKINEDCGSVLGKLLDVLH